MQLNFYIYTTLIRMSLILIFSKPLTCDVDPDFFAPVGGCLKHQWRSAQSADLAASGSCVCLQHKGSDASRQLTSPIASIWIAPILTHL